MPDHRTTSERVTFGQTLRGARLGYHWHPKLRAMMRMTVDGPTYIVWLCPPDRLPSGVSRSYPRYRCWWEGHDPVPLSPVLRDMCAVTEPLCFRLDGEGNLIAMGVDHA